MKSTKIKVEIELLERMLGTAPDPGIYDKYIASKAPEGTNTKDEIESLEQLEERGTTRFHKDENGLFIYNYMIIGFLKEAGNTLKEQIGVKNLKSKIEQFVFVNPRKLHLDKSKPDGEFERPKRVNGPMGPQSTLGKSEFVAAGLKINFEITLLDNKEIKADTLETILEYGQFKGLGQWRNGGYGAFKVNMFIVQ